MPIQPYILALLIAYFNDSYCDDIHLIFASVAAKRASASAAAVLGCRGATAFAACKPCWIAVINGLIDGKMLNSYLS